MKKIKIGLIGCGAIGSELAKVISNNFRNQAVLAYVHDHRPEKAEAVVKRFGGTIQDLKTLIRKSDFIIEAASAKISGSVALNALRLGKQVLIMSVGGLILPPYFQSVFKMKKGKLWIPTGALAGIDAVLAGREGSIQKATLTTRKPPEGLCGAPYFERHPFPSLKGREEVRVFRGTALEAVKAFPQNINVSAVLSLAGIGPQKTRVEIWTSKAYQKNQHEISVEGDFGKIRTAAENVPSRENPKTSRLAILSASALLRKVFSTIHIGT